MSEFWRFEESAIGTLKISIEDIFYAENCSCEGFKEGDKYIVTFPCSEHKDVGRLLTRKNPIFGGDSMLGKPVNIRIMNQKSIKPKYLDT